jgi:hypothetical protein
MALLKQSTAYTRAFLLVQTSDHLSGLTGATPAVTLSKAGSTFASAGGTVTEVSSGWYKIALTTTDTNTVGDLAYHITATSGDPTDFTDQVSATILGDTLSANVLSWNGAGVATPNVSGVPIVDMKYTLGTISPAAAGSVAPDWAQVQNKTSTVALTNTTVATVTSVTNAVSIASNLKKNASGRLTFTLTDSTTHNPKTGVTVTAQVSIDGAAFASCTNSVVEISNGAYTLSLAAADTNGNCLMFRFTGTGADDLDIMAITQP